MKKLIVIEGVDGAGKTTNAKKVANYLNDHGFKAKYLHFPNYDSLPGKQIKDMLNGKYSNDAFELNPYAISVMYSIDRWNSIHSEYKKYFDDDECIIICDRYLQSNLEHQGAKLLNTECNSCPASTILRLKDYYDWLTDLEYRRMRIPKPDKVIFLTLDKDTIKERLNNDGKDLDIHENDKFVESSIKASSFYKDMDDWYVLDSSFPEREVFIAVLEEVLAEVCPERKEELLNEFLSM